VLDSRHFTNEPLALIDSAEAYARQLVLEHFLPGTEPF
jgi:hypothetical protein